MKTLINIAVCLLISLSSFTQSAAWWAGSKEQDETQEEVKYFINDSIDNTLFLGYQYNEAGYIYLSGNNMDSVKAIWGTERNNPAATMQDLYFAKYYQDANGEAYIVGQPYTSVVMKDSISVGDTITLAFLFQTVTINNNKGMLGIYTAGSSNSTQIGAQYFWDGSTQEIYLRTGGSAATTNCNCIIPDTMNFYVAGWRGPSPFYFQHKATGGSSSLTDYQNIKWINTSNYFNGASGSIPPEGYGRIIYPGGRNTGGNDVSEGRAWIGLLVFDGFLDSNERDFLRRNFNRLDWRP